MLLMTRDMERELLHRQAEEIYKQSKLERAQFAAIELRSEEVIKENRTHNRFFTKTMIDSDIACRLSFHSYSASEKLTIMTEMSREFGFSYEDEEAK